MGALKLIWDTTITSVEKIKTKIHIHTQKDNFEEKLWLINYNLFRNKNCLSERGKMFTFAINHKILMDIYWNLEKVSTKKTFKT